MVLFGIGEMLEDKAVEKSRRDIKKLADIVGMEQSTVSHQLRVLRQENLVKVRRDGKQSYYSLEDDHIRKIFEMGLEHILE